MALKKSFRCSNQRFDIIIIFFLFLSIFKVRLFYSTLWLHTLIYFFLFNHFINWTILNFYHSQHYFGVHWFYLNISFSTKKLASDELLMHGNINVAMTLDLDFYCQVYIPMNIFLRFEILSGLYGLSFRFAAGRCCYCTVL